MCVMCVVGGVESGAGGEWETVNQGCRHLLRLSGGGGGSGELPCEDQRGKQYITPQIINNFATTFLHSIVSILLLPAERLDSAEVDPFNGGLWDAYCRVTEYNTIIYLTTDQPVPGYTCQADKTWESSTAGFKYSQTTECSCTFLVFSLQEHRNTKTWSLQYELSTKLNLFHVVSTVDAVNWRTGLVSFPPRAGLGCSGVYQLPQPRLHQPGVAMLSAVRGEAR